MPKAAIAEIEYPKDGRGFVIEPINATELPRQRNNHIGWTLPGAVRGNHFHRHSTEISVVVGPALVRLREDGEIRDITVPPGKAYRFTLPPEVSHAFQNTGTSPLLIVAFSTAEHNPSNPDLVRDVLIAS